MIVSERYTIEDLYYYNGSTISSSTSLNVPNFPTNYELKYKTSMPTYSTSSQQFSWFEIGTDSNNFNLLGITSSQGSIGVYVKQNGSYIASQTSSTGVFPLNTEVEIVYKYENGVHTISYDNTVVNLNNSNVTNKTYQYLRIQNTYVKDIKIKEL